MITRTLTAALAAAGMSFAAATPALAQAQAQGQAQGQMQVQPIENSELTDAQVEAFIDAATEIRAVIQEYQPQMQAAETQDAQRALQQEAQGELVIAVEDSGLTPEEYQRIAAAAQSDAEVAQRLQAEAESRAEGAQ